jgi:hypothetical protein
MMRIAFVTTLLASVHAICDGQHADLTLVCNDKCYQCCWTTCLSYTIEGGVCGTDAHGTQEYEDCVLGGSCLSGHCPIAPSGGGGDSYDGGDGGGGGGGGGLGGGSIAGISIGSICGAILLAGIARCLCKHKDHSEHLTEMTPAAIK